MRRRKVLNRYPNCYEGDCLFCHDVTCQVERGYQKEEYEIFTPEDYKNHIVTLAGFMLNEGADGLIKHFRTLLDYQDKRLIFWAIDNCSDEAALAELAKNTPHHWNASPYSGEISYLVNKISDEGLLSDLVSWADSNPGEQKLFSSASDRLGHIQLIASRRKENVTGMPEIQEDEYDCEHEYDEDEPEEYEMTQEELFEAAKNYMKIDEAEKALYQLTDRGMLAELAKGEW